MQLEQTPETLQRIGNMALLSPSIALFCSAKCVGTIIVMAYYETRELLRRTRSESLM